MRRLRSILVIILIYTSCSKNKDEQLIVGDLFFSEFRMGSFYNLSDSVILSVKNIVDTTDMATADSETKRIVAAYNMLASKGVLYKPYIDLKLADDSFVKLYLDSTDYNRIKVFKRQTLRDQRKKVVVKALTREISKGETPFLYCVELVGLEIIEGETLPGTSKFEIEDYN